MYVLEMKLLGSRMMRKYQVRFRGGITEKEPLATSPVSYPTPRMGESWASTSVLSTPTSLTIPAAKSICA